MKMVKPSKQSSRRHTTICQMRGKSLDSGYDPQGKLFPPFMLWDFPRPLVEGSTQNLHQAYMYIVFKFGCLASFFKTTN